MSDNKQPKIALFLGAGASKPFGKPTTKELKNELLEEYKKLENEIRRKYAGQSENPRKEELWYSILLHSILSFDEFEDIEHVLQALKEIYDFFINSQYGGKYVKNLIKRNYADEYSPASGLDWRFSEYVKTITEQRRKIENNIFEHYKWKYSKVEKLGQKIYDQLFPEILKHSNSNDIRIFTTNYDRTIEEYCDPEQRNYHCIDGFRSIRGWGGGRKWDKGKYEPQLAEGEIPVYLYKLHGSLDWKKHKKHGIVATGEEGISSDSNYIEPMLVYPTLSPKDGQEVKPYKTIREKFKKELLKSTDVCIVIGFSFRDKHIKSIFSKFLKLGARTLIVVSPSAEKSIRENLLKKRERSQARWASSVKGKDILLNDQNGNEIIAINDGISANNAENIIYRIFSLSSQTRQQAS